MSSGNATDRPPQKRRKPSAKEQARRVAQGKEIGAKSAAAYKALTEER